MGDVKLIGIRTSPFVNRVQIALNIKSIEYEDLPQKFGPKSDLLLKSNPVYKKVPVLIHNDQPICESLVIVEYIDELWTSGPSILPSGPYDRAIARFWAAYLDEKYNYNVCPQSSNKRKMAIGDVKLKGGRYLGFKSTFQLNRRKLVELLDLHLNGTILLDEFSGRVRLAHEIRKGLPAHRKVNADKPKEEDYFYSNPQECFCEKLRCDDLLGHNNFR